MDTIYESDSLYDVYVFDGKYGQQVCIRYGDEPWEYLGAGELELFLRTTSRNGLYEAARHAMLRKGKFECRYVRRSETAEA